MSTNIFLKKMGKEIRCLRKTQSLSQEKLAEKIGISRNYLGMIERAETNVPMLTFFEIAKALSVQPYELLKFEKD